MYSHRCCSGYGGLKTYLPLLLQPAHGITTHALRTQIIAASSSLSIVREGAPVTVHPLTPEVSFRISSNNKTKLGRIATNRLNSAPANPLLQVLSTIESSSSSFCTVHIIIVHSATKSDFVLQFVLLLSVRFDIVCHSKETNPWVLLLLLLFFLPPTTVASAFINRKRFSAPSPSTSSPAPQSQPASQPTHHQHHPKEGTADPAELFSSVFVRVASVKFTNILQSKFNL